MRLIGMRSPAWHLTNKERLNPSAEICNTCGGYKMRGRDVCPNCAEKSKIVYNEAHHDGRQEIRSNWFSSFARAIGAWAGII